jgi:predicted SnoaL-like aldol condensation-catalyzing enzyme
MGASDNKAIVRRLWTEVIATGNLETFDDVVAPDFVHLGHDGDAVAQFKDAITTAAATLKAQRFDEIEMVADRDLVFALVNYVVTHPDDSVTSRRGLLYYRLADGKIIENMMAAPVSA